MPFRYCYTAILGTAYCYRALGPLSNSNSLTCLHPPRQVLRTLTYAYVPAPIELQLNLLRQVTTHSYYLLHLLTCLHPSSCSSRSTSLHTAASPKVAAHEALSCGCPWQSKLVIRFHRYHELARCTIPRYCPNIALIPPHCSPISPP